MITGTKVVCYFMNKFSFCYLSVIIASQMSIKSFCHNTFTVKSFTAESTKSQFRPWCKKYSTDSHLRIPWCDSTTAILLEKLELTLKNRQIDVAWDLFNDIKKLQGFPKLSLLRRLVNELSYSSESHWLGKAYDLVLSVSKEKPDLLHHDYLASLALSLARAGMPIPASSVSRIILENSKFLPMDIWATIFLHMVKTPTGAYLASDILADICEKHISKHPKSTAPNIVVFNVVLNACVGYGATLKAQHMIEDLLPRTGVTADVWFMVIVPLIYERNGLVDELKKFKVFVERISTSLDQYYLGFYNSLLRLYFRYSDINAASELVQYLYRRRFSLSCSTGLIKNYQNPEIVHLGSCNLRAGLVLHIEPERMDNGFVFGQKSSEKLVSLVDEKLMVSKRGLARLINGYVKDAKICELSNVLVKIGKEMPSLECSSFVTDIVAAFVELGWLETAHDILDSFETAEMPVGPTAYRLLMGSYCVKNYIREAKILLKQMRNLGLFVKMTDEEVVSSCLTEKGDNNTKSCLANRSELAYLLLEQPNEEESKQQTLLSVLNSSIYFFCKAKMMEDALKVYRKMLAMKLQPTVQTFSYLMNGYSSLQCYREMTMLWGEIRRRMDSGVLAADWYLLDSLLVSFIKGGYFERVVEIAEYMKKHSLFTDKWKYRREFLTLHKNLYRRLKASEARTEAQKKRAVNVRAFKKWVGI